MRQHIYRIMEEKKLQKARNEKERKEICSDKANYAPMSYIIPDKEDKLNYGKIRTTEERNVGC